MLSIYLHNVIFFAYHGLYEEEKTKGGEFEVNLTVQYRPHASTIVALDDTINYVSLFNLVKARMSRPTELLETIAMDICHEIMGKFTLAEAVYFSIKKLRPPIHDFTGSVGVSFEVKRNS